jgi:hypothetical protein
MIQIIEDEWLKLYIRFIEGEWFRLLKVNEEDFWRCVEDVLKMCWRCVEDVWRCVEDVWFRLSMRFIAW